ncbi:MAG: hypothetical protein J6C33_05360 [Lachnospiraceae bacterium]|nr:hypothetical protein [Lachnospiraceae bacterium]
MQEMNEMQECGKKLNGTIIKAITVILMILFFFPLCTVSCGTEKEKINGIKATFGLEVLGEHVDGNILCGLLFLLPLVLFIALLYKKQITKNMALLTGAVGLFDVVLLFVFKSRVTKQVEEALSTVEFDMGYYGEIVGNIILIVLAILSWRELILLYNQGKISLQKNAVESTGNRNNSSVAVVVAMIITYSIIGLSLLIFGQ